MMGTMRKKTLGIFNLSSVAFLLACLIGIQPLHTTISNSSDNFLAPISIWQEDELKYDGPLNIVRFADQNVMTPYEKPTKNELEEEVVQLVFTFLNPRPGRGVKISDLPPADLSPIEGELFIISDVHLTGRKWGGLKQWKYKQLVYFLNAVAKENGNLIINGDFFESNLNTKDLFDHLEHIYKLLRRIKRVFYFSGNHDANLQVLHGKRWKNITFLDSMSFRDNNRNPHHIEHGHKTDWWWHHIVEAEVAPFYKRPFSTFGKKIILMKQNVEKRGYALGLRWTQFVTLIYIITVLPIYIQLIWWDIRFREVRSQFPKEWGIQETLIPFYLRILFFWEWPKQLKRMWWEFKVPKDEPTTHIHMGHRHEGDQIALYPLKRLFLSSESRIKVYFTAGRWVTLALPMRLKFTRITPEGKVTYENVEDFLPIGKAKKESFYTRKTGRFSFPLLRPIQVITPIETSL